ncbi:MAG: sigma-70 family RNA polymerase sigma factor [Bacteroidetes bacterium]|nr:sigma-70 family RNA polymerase sigma factor [Bacteroidota bacterium]
MSLTIANLFILHMQEIPKSVLTAMSENDVEAYFFVFQQYCRPLFYYFDQQGLTRAEAQDLIVELMENLIKSITATRPKQWTSQQIEEWIYQEVRDLSASKINLTVNMNGTLEGQADDIEKDGAKRIEIELLNILHQGIEALPEPHKTVFKLRHLQELSNQEIATQIGLPETTVRQLRSEALLILKQQTLQIARNIPIID